MSSISQGNPSIDNTSSLSKSKLVIVVDEPKKNKRIQINSLESLRYAMQAEISTGMKQRNDSNSPKKTIGNPSLKASNSLSLSSQDLQLDSVSQMSMNQSSLQLTKKKKQSRNFNEFEKQMQNEEQNADSPEKLRRKLKQFPKIQRQKISLLCPPQDLWKSSYQFMDEQYSQIQKQTHNRLIMQRVKEFLINPLPFSESLYMRYIFEIHLFKYTFTFHTCYEFYLRNSDGEMIHLARSEKDSLTISSSHLLYATNPHKSGQKEFVAKLKYNTAKSQYNLYDIDEKQNPNQPRKLLATGFYEKNIGDQRDIKLYIPKLQFSHNDFIKSQTHKNMASFYNKKQNPVYRPIQVLKTTKIFKQSENKAREELELKNEGRKILLVNEEGQERFYMGKKQDERYIILAASGLTPLQVFSLSILNLDH